MANGAVIVIFDLDNTLVDSSIDFAALRRALLDLWETAGPLPAPREDLVRLAIPEIVARLTAAAPALAPAAWALVERFEVEGLRDARPVPDAARVLATLAARGVRIAVLTNNSRAAARAALDAGGLAPYVTVLVGREDVPALKPDPAGVRQIVARLGPGTPYVVGDSWIDAAAAAAAGVRFVGVGRRRADVEARGIRPWAWISRLEDLLTVDLRA
ncbi:MAG: HAD-IA family hydrolase [Armatimonadota bacterium]|nr:HAD-IA family hydrolase [Armatimonadota bacterium]MDR7532367.1 HAD-IA family hydrolase [Armatimonadota bacterium]MDR7535294.1 HAD-IA family hydrolase [Armatimonadota bacterium]